MQRTKRRIADNKTIVPDGGRVRVPLMLMDSLQRQVAMPRLIRDAAVSATHDSRGNIAGSRPGFIFSDADTGRKQIADAYDTYDRDITTAYQNSPTGIGTPEQFRGQVEGDLCSIHGMAGRLKNVDGSLRCVPNGQSADAADITCPDCDGDGYLDNGKQCETCDGTGYIEDDDQQQDALATVDARQDALVAYSNWLVNAWRHE